MRRVRLDPIAPSAGRALLAAAVLAAALVVVSIIGLATLPGDSGHSADAAGPDVSVTGSALITSGPPAPASGAAATGSTATTGAPSTTTGAPASSRAPASSKAPANGSATAACTDIQTIRTLNAALNQTSITTLRTQFAQLDQAAKTLVTDAPAQIVKPAKKFSGAVTTLHTFIDKAKSVDDLAQATQRDQKLAGAFADLSAADTDITGWSTKHCAS